MERSWGTPWPAECFGLNLPWVGALLEGGALMKNLITKHNVDGAVYWAVDRAVDRAGDWAVRRTLYQAGTRGMYGAMAMAGGLVVHEAIAQREEPPHPGLGLYLGGVV